MLIFLAERKIADPPARAARMLSRFPHIGKPEDPPPRAWAMAVHNLHTPVSL